MLAIGGKMRHTPLPVPVPDEIASGFPGTDELAVLRA
jgi:hypothetical protein